MFPAPKPVAPRRSMNSRKQVSFLKIGLVKICSRTLEQLTRRIRFTNIRSSVITVSSLLRARGRRLHRRAECPTRPVHRHLHLLLRLWHRCSPKTSRSISKSRWARSTYFGVVIFARLQELGASCFGSAHCGLNAVCARKCDVLNSSLVFVLCDEVGDLIFVFCK